MQFPHLNDMAGDDTPGTYVLPTLVIDMSLKTTETSSPICAAWNILEGAIPDHQRRVCRPVDATRVQLQRHIS